MAALIPGGNAPAETAQQPDGSPSATQPSSAAPIHSAKPMSDEPNISNPQATQDQQASPAGNDQTKERDSSKANRDPTNVGSDLTQDEMKAFDHFLDNTARFCAGPEERPIQGERRCLRQQP
jgi:hypothetical protein